MNTRPASVRFRHDRVMARSAVAGLASFTWMVAGTILVALTAAWWSWLLVAVGAVLLAAFVGLLPRLRRARVRLAEIEQIRVEQLRAEAAQRQARMLAFGQTELR